MSPVRRSPTMGLTLTRYRRPRAKSALRTASSGPVSLERFEIIARRVAGVDAQELIAISSLSIALHWRTDVRARAMTPRDGVAKTSRQLAACCLVLKVRDLAHVQVELVSGLRNLELNLSERLAGEVRDAY